ncbi:MAG: dinitrogenase iron-molybdenum cofactor [Candidatus Omnitrophica bacterium]|nr:dinitrogenase iron-molybdenum cofactor [Candidatus Omnitrophota bacterium]
MRIAISTDGGDVSAHFGRCPSFTLFNVESGKVTGKEEVPNPGHHPGFLPDFLQGKGVNCIIAGGMGQRASMLFGQKGIAVIVGVEGDVDEAAEAFASGKLSGGESLCKPGAGKGYGVEKTECDHAEEDGHAHQGG